MPKRRTKGDGGLIQRHDHPNCPALVLVGHDDKGRPVKARPEHPCRGRWVGTVDVQLPGGTTKRKYVYGKTQAEARRKLAKAVAERDAGTLAFDGGLTVEKWMDQWLERRRKPPKPLKPQTWNGYVEKNRSWIRPHLGQRRLSDLRPHHIDALYDLMRSQGKAEATIRQVHAILSKALGDAVRKTLIAVSPMERVDPPGTETNDRAQFTLAQARQALEAAGDSARWWLALFYGMRQGECLGLRWEDVDFERHTLTVAATDQADYGGKARIEGAPKSRTSRRTLPMTGHIEARLKLLHADQGEPRTGRVFLNGRGAPLAPRADWAAWRAFIDSATVVPFAPLPYIALHAARNTAASLMEAASIPDRMVAQILGHANVKQTHGYQAGDLERVGEALLRAEHLLGVSSPPEALR